MIIRRQKVKKDLNSRGQLGVGALNRYILSLQRQLCPPPPFAIFSQSFKSPIIQSAETLDYCCASEPNTKLWRNVISFGGVMRPGRKNSSFTSSTDDDMRGQNWVTRSRADWMRLDFTHATYISTHTYGTLVSIVYFLASSVPSPWHIWHIGHFQISVGSLPDDWYCMYNTSHCFLRGFDLRVRSTYSVRIIPCFRKMISTRSQEDLKTISNVINRILNEWMNEWIHQTKLELNSYRE